MRGIFAAFFVALVVFLAMPASSALASTDPTGYWKFDEASAGINAADSIGSNNAVPTGNPTPSATVPPVSFTDTGSMSFDGSNYFTINRPVQEDFTICAWIKTTSTGGGTAHWTSAPIMDSEVGGLANDFGFGIGNGGKLMYGNGGSFDFQVNGNTVINDDAWHNVCATRNNSNGDVYLYVDAHVDGNGTTSTGILSRNPSARIGYGYDGAAHYVGLIDDVRVYNVALNQSQLANITAGSSDPDTPPDDTPPTISNLAESGITDARGNISWDTDEDASSKVAYSVDSTYASSTEEYDLDPRVTDHSITLKDLLSCTLYNFEAVSSDAAGNYATSSPGSFITTGCAGGVSPSSSTSTLVTVNAAATSTITDTGRTLTVATPANFTSTSSSIVIQIKGLSSGTVLDSIGKPSSDLTSAASIVFDVTALIDSSTVLDSFDAPVTISYTYTDADINGLDESSLSMYHYHAGSWIKLDNCSVDTAANKITCDTPSFSTFAIFGTAQSSSNSGSDNSGGGGGWAGGCMTYSVDATPWWGAVPCIGGSSGQLALETSAPLQVAQSTACPSYAFTRNLKFGMTGEDVRALQKLMNCLGFTLATSGPGSPGNETNLFVDRTFGAVVKFQETYSSDILTPINATKGTGIFAEFSQKKAQALSGK